MVKGDSPLPSYIRRGVQKIMWMVFCALPLVLKHVLYNVVHRLNAVYVMYMCVQNSSVILALWAESNNPIRIHLCFRISRVQLRADQWRSESTSRSNWSLVRAGERLDLLQVLLTPTWAERKSKNPTIFCRTTRIINFQMVVIPRHSHHMLRLLQFMHSPQKKLNFICFESILILRS